MKNKTILNDKDVIDYYLNNSISTEGVALHFHVGKKKINDIFKRNGIEKKKKGGQSKGKTYAVNDWKIEKYSKRDGYHYEAWSKDGKIRTKDYMNQGGFLTTYIQKTYGVTPPNLYFRREYYKETGNYWWEQWFDIKLIKDKQTKKCPFCDWETVDIDNKSGTFEQHIMKIHKMNPTEYLNKYPQDAVFFKKYLQRQSRLKKIMPVKSHVVCPICGKSFSKITETHLQTHGLTMEDFRKKYFDYPILSHDAAEQCQTDLRKGNLAVPQNRFVSKPEQEIQEFLKSNNIKFETNRQFLISKEIDILIPDKKIGIEFDGLLWHSEFFGKKTHRYHLEKTQKCNEKGYGLIHIFEDEFAYHKDIVFSKLKHILGIDKNLPKIAARKCEVKEIIKKDAEDFLNIYHIQGFGKSTVYLGAFFKDELVGVMSFKNGSIKNDGWELTRYATKPIYQYQGLGSKIFTFFIRNFNPEIVYSFADRRWTLMPNENLYTKMGFELASITAPDYRYFNRHAHRPLRIHKMTFSKKNLIKKYGFSSDLTEKEMTLKLGYDRIWDCGLFKYVWYNKELIKN